MTAINVKTVVNKVTDTLETVKTSTEKANDYALKSTENLVVNTLKTVSKWQDVSAKAVKGSLEFTAKQQDVIFDSLESAKVQVVKGIKKTKNLFSKN